LGAVNDYVVAELSKTATGLVVGAQPAIAQLSGAPFAEMPVERGKSLPGEFGRGPETTNTKVAIEGKRLADNGQADRCGKHHEGDHRDLREA